MTTDPVLAIEAALTEAQRDAPETFSNTLERWIWAVAADAPELAERCIAAIEQRFTAAGTEVTR
jgi:hypothetical protein